jgi:arginine deiminase
LALVKLVSLSSTTNMVFCMGEPLSNLLFMRNVPCNVYNSSLLF